MAEVFPYKTMVEMLRYWSTHEPHKPAFIFVDKHRNRFELSRQQLYDLGDRWAAVVQEGGVGRRERVVSTLVNCPERALCDVGIVLAGAVVVNAQFQLADGSDLLLVLRQSKACAVCVDPDLDLGPWHVLQEHVQLDPLTKTVTSPSLPDLRKVFFIRRTSPLPEAATMPGPSRASESPSGSQGSQKEKHLKDGFSTPETGDFIASLQNLDGFYEADVAAEETVVVATTSGSTGFSKLVPQSHQSFLRYFGTLKRPGLEFYVSFNSAPFGWLGGTVFMAPSLGTGRVLLDMWYGIPPDLAAVVWETVVQERCHEAVLMPFLLPRILALEDRKPWRMTTVLISGQPVKKEMVHQALQLADTVAVVYGSTELLTVSIFPVKDASQYQDYMVGKPPPGCTVKVCNAKGEEAGRGNKGEILAKTPFMMESYLNSPEDTSASFTGDGFLKTGDIGVALDDGSLLVVGRHFDAIHRGSYIFYPAWLESRIMHCCPGLQEIAVVGVPDPAMGEEICACFVPSDSCLSEEGVRSLVEEDILPTLEDPLSPRPRYYLRFQAFPRTYTDKPLRKDVRRLAIERLRLA